MRSGRRKARADALQILYQLDLNSDLAVSAALGHFENSFAESGGVDEFTRRLVLGVTEHVVDLDSRIDSTSEHWRTDRMAVVDRNLLRLGAFELFYCDDIPATVSINEMIEIAKEFGSETSPAFINGVLDKLKGKLVRPEKAP